MNDQSPDAKAAGSRLRKEQELVVLGQNEPSHVPEEVPARPALDLTKIKALLDKGEGPKFWRGLEDLADTEEMREFLDDEFPDRKPDWFDPANRRKFLKIMGASLGLAGLAACTKQPRELIVPYVRQPEDIVPGKPLFFATAMEFGGYGTGLLVRNNEGHPTKIEGNPDHPGSLGASDYFHQASLLTMYDPDRSQTVLYNGGISAWVNFESALGRIRGEQVAKGGAGFRLLTETVLSPTLAAQIKALQTGMPQMKWQPAARVGSSGGAAAAFGRPVNTMYAFDKADVVVSLDADFLACGPGNLRHSHDFASRRNAYTNVAKTAQPKENRQEGFQAGPDAPLRNQASEHVEHDNSPLQNPAQVMPEGVPIDQITQNRLYVVEPCPSPTGSMADHRYPLQAGQVLEFARQLAAAVGGGTVQAPSGLQGPAAKAFQDIAAIARDLKAHSGSSIVIAGEFQPAEVHALAHAMNAALGNVGKTVNYTEPIEANPVDQMQSLKDLVGDLNAGQVEALLILGGNPVYNAPVDLNFKAAIGKAKWRAHLSLYWNETSELCNWHIPAVHYLETWSDTRGFDGTASIVQPLIAPMYDGRSSHEVLSVLTQQSESSPNTIVKKYWSDRMPGADFETRWQTWLHDGVIPNTAAAAVTVTGKAPAAGASSNAQGIEVIIRPDPTIWDGTFTNNSWLQELPKPATKTVWDNAVLMNPSLAQQLGVNDQDLVQVSYRGQAITGPAALVPGHAPNSVSVHMGYGRWRSGHITNNIGHNAFLLQTSDAPGGGYGGDVKKTGGKYLLAASQHAQTMEEREPIRMATLEEFKKNAEFVTEKDKPLPKWLSLYPDYAYEGYKWGMSIDLNKCVGCSACEIACYAENNIAVVGKDQVSRGRIMHWIRVDRYFKGNWDNPELYYQPLACVMCENAPCELVCPVAATVHSGEGLNQMVYNRCVGTRYCSNNCPYKVRRFNFYLFSDWNTQSLYPMRNPNVTVRSRGVMEKCTYCVQRINSAKITAEIENRRVQDGEIVPACAQACPTRAIVFGDINDPNSQVAKLKAQVRDYSLLEELNTRPRTTYLGRLRNPNPEIEKG